MRIGRNAAIVFTLVAGALLIGAAGYHVFSGLSWLDATVNAAMILTGMGPVDPDKTMVTSSAKLFAIAYSLFSGVFFLSMTAILLAPAVQYFLHRFHLQFYGDGDGFDGGATSTTTAAPPRDARGPAPRKTTTRTP